MYLHGLWRESTQETIAEHRLLRVARTLADLDGQPAVRRIHIAEALSYRRLTPAAAPARRSRSA